MTEDDFFEAVGDNVLNSKQTAEDDVKSFADAISARFGNAAGDQQQTARLIAPPLPLVHMPSTPLANLYIDHNQPSEFIPVPPMALSGWLQDALILDIRPHAAYSLARVSKAVSLSVPSTLLKRPLFSLQRLSAMLPSHSARAHFSAWRSAPRILVYDADSVSISETSNIHGLLRKFRAEAPDADIPLAWIQGGFQAVWQLRRDCVDIAPPTPETETEDEEPEALSKNRRVLRTHHLPRAAFGYSTTTQVQRTAAPPLNPRIKLPSAQAEDEPSAASNPFFDNVRQNSELKSGITERIPLRLPRRVRRRVAELPFHWLREIARHAGPSTPPGVVVTTATFDFSSMTGFRGRPDSSEEDGSDSGPSTREGGRWTPSDASPGPKVNVVDEDTDALAMQFYRIELAEQRRLMGVMAHHSRESGVEPNGTTEGKHGPTDSKPIPRSALTAVASDARSRSEVRKPFPFSITAGVEKGSKNRYRNIWPFEHARVRLHRQNSQLPTPTASALVPSERRLSPTEYDDYVNASYVQPLGTSRLYIATQGPLESTFGDFWTLVWQQNTHVIVMLTREVESSQVKCGSYWRPGTYGMLRVELLGCAAEGCPGVCSVCAGADDTVGGAPGYFTAAGASTPRSSTQIIKRTLRLTHTGHPSVPPRRVVQLQYLGWPDMNVPEDARGVLELVWDLGRVVEEVGAAPNARPCTEVQVGESLDEEIDQATGVLRRILRLGDAGAPVLLHCSAGVGRTGGFIAIDAVLDAVRMEVRELCVSGRGDDGVRTKSGWGRSSGSSGSSGARRSGSEGPRGINADMRAVGIAEDDDRMDVDPSTQKVTEDEQPEGWGTRTPMPVDVVGADYVDMDKTQRWVENVADTKVLSAFAPPVPDTAPSSMCPSPPSSADVSPPSFQLRPPAHRSTPSSFLATVNRSLPAEESPQKSSSLPTVNRSLPAEEGPQKSSSLPINSKAGSGVIPLAVRRGYADHRLRTFSAPNAPPSPSQLPTNRAPWLLPSEHNNVQSPQGKQLTPSRSLGGSSLRDRPLARSLSPFTSNSQQSLASASEPNEPGLHVDYKEPRALHKRGGAGPVRLSQFEDPIWEVMQDMREQRMSLCQSLRQYVFVHAAIVEGALMVADEERARAGVSWRLAKLPYVTSDEGTSSTWSTGKRQASPTELPKEDKKGELALSKRPSIKRKQASGDEYPHPLLTFPPP